MTAVHREQQVGLLGLGGQTRGRSAALHVDQHEGELETDREAERLGLEIHAGTAGRRHPELAGERAPDGDADGGDLVLGLHRANTEVLVLRQLVEDVRRRGDRVRGVQDRQLRLLARRDQPVRERHISGDVAVPTGRQSRRMHLEGRLEDLRGLAEVVARLERREVGVAHHRLRVESLVDPRHDRIDRTGVHPEDQAECEEVLGPLGVPGLGSGPARRLDGDARHRHRVDGVLGERAVLERVGGVPGLLEVPGLERIGVGDDRGARGQVGEIGLERRGVHGHEEVRHVTGSDDVEVRDVDLEARHSGDRARRGPDLGRIVRQGGQIVAERGAHVGEAVTDQLHAVAGVSGESDDDPFEDFGPSWC